MNKKYLIPASALVFVGILLSFTKVKTDFHEELTPADLHKEIMDHSRYKNVDEIAHQIITKDPLLLLIDVRPAKEFEKFSLPNAVNIPIDSMLLPNYQDYLGQETYNAVFYSNGTLTADQAWILCKRMAYTNNYVMRGGLNAWVEDILKPVDDNDIYDKLSDEQIQFRRGASQYFGGGTATVESTDKASKPTKKVVRRKKKEVEGGCG